MKSDIRPLTAEEIATRDQRRAEMKELVDECEPVLIDFMERLAAANPHSVAYNAEGFVSTVDGWMKLQQVDPEARVWIITRIGYFIATLLNQKFGGQWYVDEDPDSPYFLRYVIGRFSKLANPDVKFEPFWTAEYYVDRPPGRSLIEVLRQLEDGVEKMQPGGG